MGKDDKEESGFGFKDRAKAEETLRLLQQHERGYQRLTVRGLLTRAKRVLSLTKAEEKIKNIKEAMAVFEQWQQEHAAGDKDKKTEKKPRKDKDSDNEESSSDVEMEAKPKEEKPSDKVPGLGFKDAAAAEGTLAALAGRDPEYQRLAVKGLLGSAKRVLASTRDETKQSNIKEAMSILEKFLEDYESSHLARENNSYLPLGLVHTSLGEAGDLATKQQRAFIAAYASVGGEYKRLRTVPEKEGGKTWDIVRNSALKELKEKHADAKLFDSDDKPTSEHLEMLLWAYSPDAARAKKLIHETKDNGGRKRKSSHSEESPSKRAK